MVREQEREIKIKYFENSSILIMTAISLFMVGWLVAIIPILGIAPIVSEVLNLWGWFFIGLLAINTLIRDISLASDDNDEKKHQVGMGCAKNMFDIAWIFVTMTITVLTVNVLKIGLEGYSPLILGFELVNFLKSVAIAIGIGAGAAKLLSLKEKKSSHKKVIYEGVTITENIIFIIISLALAIYLGNLGTILVVLTSMYILKRIWEALFVFRGQVWSKIVVSSNTVANWLDGNQHLYPNCQKNPLVVTVKETIRDRCAGRIELGKDCLRHHKKAIALRVLSFDIITFLASYATGFLAPFTVAMFVIGCVAVGIVIGIEILEKNGRYIIGTTVAFVYLLGWLMGSPISGVVDVSMAIAIAIVWVVALPVRKFITEKASRLNK